MAAMKALQVPGSKDDPYWQQALKEFEASHRPKPPKEGFRGSLTRESRLEKIEFFEEFLRDQSSVQEARKVCTQIQASANDQYTNQTVNLILGNLDYVIKAGDIAFKGGAESFAMAWSGVKFIMLAIQADQQNCRHWASAGAAISTILVACRTLGRLYTMPEGEVATDAANEVTSKLPSIYLSILTFSYAAKKQLDRNKARRIFDQYSPFSSAGDASMGQLESIKAVAKDIREASNVAFQEWSKKASEQSLEGQQDIKEQVESFKKTFIEHEESQTALLQSISNLMVEVKTHVVDINVKVDQLLQVSGLKDPYDADKQRFNINKQKLEPQDKYRQTTYESKVKIHDQMPSTCKWIFDEEMFVDWRDSEESSILWISGGGGYGKSILVTHVIETLKSTETVAYFYCSKIGSSEANRHAQKIKQDLVAQLYELTVDSREQLADANRVFTKPANGKPKPGQVERPKETGPTGLPDMNSAFLSLAEILDRKIFIVIDAMDECVDRIDEAFISSLQDWIAHEKVTLKILISSRREPDLELELSEQANLRVEEFNSEDIRAHTNAELAKIPGLSSNEKAQVCSAIVDRAHGQFTYVNLAMQLLKKPIVRPIEKVISRLAENNRSMNQETLRSIDPAYSDLAKTCLTWTLLRHGAIKTSEVMDIFSGTYLVEENSEDIDPAATAETNGVEENAENEGSIAGSEPMIITDTTNNSKDGEEEANDEDQQDAEAETQDEEDENIDLYVKQVNAAAGPFLEVKLKPNYYLIENHPSVRESFLNEVNHEEIASSARIDRECPTCGKAHNEKQDFIIDPKWDHLEIVVKCLKHMNNSQFRDRYFSWPDAEEEGEADGDGESVGSNEAETTASDGEIVNGEEAAVASEVNAEGAATEGTVPNTAKVSSEEAEHSKTSESAPEAGEVNGEEKAEESTEETPAASAETYDSEDEIEENDYAEDESDPGDYDGEDDETNNVPYVIRCWPYHLREAEMLWGWRDRVWNPEQPEEFGREWQSEDSRTRELWTELRNELKKLFIDDKTVFRGWLNTAGAHADILTTRGFTPAHVAAVYGLYSLAVILKDEGQPFFTPADEGGSIPLYYTYYYPEQEEHVNLMKLMAHAKPEEITHLDASPIRWIGDGEETNDSSLWTFFKSDPSPQVAEAIIEILQSDPEELSQLYHRDVPLLRVASFGTYPEVVTLLVNKLGSQVTSKSVDGNTAIHNLLMRMDLPEDMLMLKAFLDIPGVDVNAEDNDSERPLVGAARRGHVTAARILIEAGADLNDIDDAGDSAMSIAAGWGSKEIVELLVEHKASPKIVNSAGKTPLYSACSWGHEETALTLLEVLKGEPIDVVDKPTNKGRTPLRRACMRSMGDVVQKILEFEGGSARVHIRDNRDQQTPLQAAAWAGHLGIVKMLLEHGANARDEDRNGFSALDVCAERWSSKADGDFEDIILALLEADPTMATKPSTGNHKFLPLTHMAASKGSCKVLDRLIDLKVNMNQKDEHGWTPLLIARQAKNDDAVALLERRASEFGQRPSALAKVASETDLIYEDENRKVTHNLEVEDFVITLTGNHPIPAEVEGFYYFEVKFETKGEDMALVGALGFTTESWYAYHYNWFPGNRHKSNKHLKSWAFRTDHKIVYSTTPNGVAVQEQELSEVNSGQTVGCGVDLEDGQLFYTLDGEHLGYACDGLAGRLFPVVTIGNNTTVSVNFGQNPFLWAPEKDEDENEEDEAKDEDKEEGEKTSEVEVENPS